MANPARLIVDFEFDGHRSTALNGGPAGGISAMKKIDIAALERAGKA